MADNKINIKGNATINSKKVDIQTSTNGQTSNNQQSVYSIKTNNDEANAKKLSESINSNLESILHVLQETRSVNQQSSTQSTNTGNIYVDEVNRISNEWKAQLDKIAADHEKETADKKELLDEQKEHQEELNKQREEDKKIREEEASQREQDKIEKELDKTTKTEFLTQEKEIQQTRKELTSQDREYNNQRLEAAREYANLERMKEENNKNLTRAISSGLRNINNASRQTFGGLLPSSISMLASSINPMFGSFVQFMLSDKGLGGVTKAMASSGFAIVKKIHEKNKKEQEINEYQNRIKNTGIIKGLDDVEVQKKLPTNLKDWSIINDSLVSKINKTQSNAKAKSKGKTTDESVTAENATNTETVMTPFGVAIPKAQNKKKSKSDSTTNQTQTVAPSTSSATSTTKPTQTVSSSTQSTPTTTPTAFVVKKTTQAISKKVSGTTAGKSAGAVTNAIKSTANPKSSKKKSKGTNNATQGSSGTVSIDITPIVTAISNTNQLLSIYTNSFKQNFEGFKNFININNTNLTNTLFNKFKPYLSRQKSAAELQAEKSSSAEGASSGSVIARVTKSFKGFWDKVKAVGLALFAGMKMGLLKIGSFFKPGGSSLLRFILSPFKLIKNGFIKIAQWILHPFTLIKNVMKGLFNAILHPLKFLKNGFNLLMKPVRFLFNSAMKIVRFASSPLVAAIAAITFLTAVFSKSFRDKIGNYWNEKVNSIRKTIREFDFKKAFIKLRDGISSMVIKLKKFFGIEGPIGEYIKSLPSKIWNWMNDFGNRVEQGIYEVGMGIIKGLVDVGALIGETVAYAFTAAKEVFGPAVNDICNSFVDWVKGLWPFGKKKDKTETKADTAAKPADKKETKADVQAKTQANKNVAEQQQKAKEQTQATYDAVKAGVVDGNKVVEENKVVTTKLTDKSTKEIVEAIKEKEEEEKKKAEAEKVEVQKKVEADKQEKTVDTKLENSTPIINDTQTQNQPAKSVVENTPNKTVHDMIQKIIGKEYSTDMENMTNGIIDYFKVHKETVQTKQEEVRNIALNNNDRATFLPPASY